MFRGGAKNLTKFFEVEVGEAIERGGVCEIIAEILVVGSNTDHGGIVGN